MAEISNNDLVKDNLKVAVKSGIFFTMKIKFLLQWLKLEKLLSK